MSSTLRKKKTIKTLVRLSEVESGLHRSPTSGLGLRSEPRSDFETFEKFLLGDRGDHVGLLR